MAEARIDILGKVEPLQDVVDFRNAVERANVSAKELESTVSDGFGRAEKAIKGAKDETGKLGKENKRQLGIVEQLEKNYGELVMATRRATDPKEFQRLKKETNEARKELEKLVDTTEELEKKGKKASGVFNLLKSSGIAGALGGASIGAVAGAALNDIRKTVEEFTKLRGEAQSLTGVTGGELDKLVSKTQAVAKTFDQEYLEVLRTANTVSKEFNVSQAEAIDIIEEGFLNGANASGDFIDSLREYPAQFANAGGNAKQFLNILVRSQEEGIFSDKGIDAVKEFNLRIREQTKTTSDAVRRLMGKDQADELLGGVRNGSITSIQALKTISGELGNTEKDSATLQTAIADIFGGPGEDAGLRFLQTLTDIDEGLVDAEGSTNSLVEAQKRQLELEEKLASTQNQLTKDFETNGNIYKELLLDLEIGWNQVVLAINRGAKSSDGFFTGFADSIIGGSDGFANMALNAGKVSDEAKEQNAEINKLRSTIVDAQRELEGLSERRTEKRVIRGGFEVETEVSDEALQKTVDDATAKLKEISPDILASIQSQIEGEINGSKPEKEKTGEVKDTADPAELERLIAAEEKKHADLLKAKDKFNADLERLDQQAAQNAIKNLEGEELIAAQLAFNDEQISVLEDRLTSELETLDLSEDERLSAEKRIEDAITGLRVEAVEEANQKIRDTRITEAQKNLGIQEQIAEQEAIAVANLTRGDEETEVEFEKRKQEALLAVQLEFAQKRLDLLTGTLTEEEKLAKLELQNLITDLNSEVSKLGEGANFKGVDGFVSKLFNTTDQGEIDAVKGSIQQVGQQLVDVGTQWVGNQIAQNENLIASIDDQIGQVQSNLEEQEDLRSRGLANSVAAEEDALDTLQKRRAKAVEEQDKLRKKQALIELAQQASSLITAAAQIANAEASKGAIGVAIAIGAVAALFGAFVKFKGDANNLAQAEEGAFFSKDYSMIGGKRHSDGGTRMTLEAEKGEGHSIWKRSAAAKYGAKLARATALINSGVDPEHVFGLNYDLPDQIRGAQAAHDKVVVQNRNAELVSEIASLKQEFRALKNAYESRPVVHSQRPGDTVVATFKDKVVRTKILKDGE